jgi:MoaA/NifB/PqqE/SkfB family radical SAM enzyme
MGDQSAVAQRNAQTLAAFFGRDRRPNGVMIQVSAKCNLGCRMCGYVGKTANVGFMTTELFCKVLHASREYGIEQVWMETAWGEPMLHPKIFDLLELAFDFRIFLSTNATPLNQRRIERLAGLQIHHLQMSFCGYDKASYEHIYRGANFDHVVENLGLVARIFGERSPGTKLLVNGVSLEYDPMLVDKTKTLLRSLGFTDQQMEIKVPMNFGGQYDGLPRDAATGLHTFKPITGQAPGICSVFLNNPAVYVDGRVTACGCIDNSGAMIIGNVNETGLREMMHGPQYDAYLQKFISGNLAGLSLCEKCDVPYTENGHTLFT